MTWHRVYEEREELDFMGMKPCVHSYQDYETGRKTPLRTISSIITTFLDPT
jgi:hypothetical protein